MLVKSSGWRKDLRAPVEEVEFGLRMILLKPDKNDFYSISTKHRSQLGNSMKRTADLRISVFA